MKEGRPEAVMGAGYIYGANIIKFFKKAPSLHIRLRLHLIKIRRAMKDHPEAFRRYAHMCFTGGLWCARRKRARQRHVFEQGPACSPSLDQDDLVAGDRYFI